MMGAHCGHWHNDPDLISAGMCTHVACWHEPMCPVWACTSVREQWPCACASVRTGRDHASMRCAVMRPRVVYLVHLVPLALPPWDADRWCPSWHACNLVHTNACSVCTRMSVTVQRACMHAYMLCARTWYFLSFHQGMPKLVSQLARGSTGGACGTGPCHQYNKMVCVCVCVCARACVCVCACVCVHHCVCKRANVHMCARYNAMCYVCACGRTGACRPAAWPCTVYCCVCCTHHWEEWPLKLCDGADICSQVPCLSIEPVAATQGTAVRSSLLCWHVVHEN